MASFLSFVEGRNIQKLCHNHRTSPMCNYHAREVWIVVPDPRYRVNIVEECSNYNSDLVCQDTGHIRVYTALIYTFFSKFHFFPPPLWISWWPLWILGIFFWILNFNTLAFKRALTDIPVISRSQDMINCIKAYCESLLLMVLGTSSVFRNIKKWYVTHAADRYIPSFDPIWLKFGQCMCIT